MKTLLATLLLVGQTGPVLLSRQTKPEVSRPKISNKRLDLTGPSAKQHQKELERKKTKDKKSEKVEDKKVKTEDKRVKSEDKKVKSEEKKELSTKERDAVKAKQLEAAVDRKLEELKAELDEFASELVRDLLEGNLDDVEFGPDRSSLEMVREEEKLAGVEMSNSSTEELNRLGLDLNKDVKYYFSLKNKFAFAQTAIPDVLFERLILLSYMDYLVTEGVYHPNKPFKLHKNTFNGKTTLKGEYTIPGLMRKAVVEQDELAYHTLQKLAETVKSDTRIASFSDFKEALDLKEPSSLIGIYNLFDELNAHPSSPLYQLFKEDVHGRNNTREIGRKHKGAYLHFPQVIDGELYDMAWLELQGILIQ